MHITVRVKARLAHGAHGLCLLLHQACEEDGDGSQHGSHRQHSTILHPQQSSETAAEGFLFALIETLQLFPQQLADHESSGCRQQTFGTSRTQGCGAVSPRLIRSIGASPQRRARSVNCAVIGLGWSARNPRGAERCSLEGRASCSRRQPAKNQAGASAIQPVKRDTAGRRHSQWEVIALWGASTGRTSGASLLLVYLLSPRTSGTALGLP